MDNWRAAQHPEAQDYLMKRQVTITARPIEEAALHRRRSISKRVGAVACFLGVVRGTEGGVAIKALVYEAFQRMAKHQIALLLDELGRRWPIESVRLVHRVGAVKPKEPSLWVEVAAPHRAEAFAACQWLVDELKAVVPIWKKPLKHKS
jgi:molybdopterin synthase catalytic subunit